MIRPRRIYGPPSRGCCRKSRTLRAQCLEIAAARQTYVSVTLSLSPMDPEARARSIARRYQSGLLVVEIQIPPASGDFAELLAHELEHVTELIERVGRLAVDPPICSPAVQTVNYPFLRT